MNILEAKFCVDLTSPCNVYFQLWCWGDFLDTAQGCADGQWHRHFQIASTQGRCMNNVRRSGVYNGCHISVLLWRWCRQRGCLVYNNLFYMLYSSKFSQLWTEVEISWKVNGMVALPFICLWKSVSAMEQRNLIRDKTVGALPEIKQWEYFQT